MEQVSTFPSSADTVVALSTPYGTGGIAVVRLSGPDALPIVSKCWIGKELTSIGSHRAHLGWITDEENERLDNVVLTLFRAPNSFTGEDVVEISCHGSVWLQQAIVNRLVGCGARVAEGGEFTRRAFMNGRLDLAQAEAVADMIAASSKAAARLAASQMKGAFSQKLNELRGQLIDLGSLLELELDFAEEEVEFADRARLLQVSREVRDVVGRLADSYKSGSVFKNGVPVVIAGRPNVGKSTLLNALVDDEKAIVSPIPGTTRDIIEETVEINGILFRFFDTAGLRSTADPIESIGVERARKKLLEASIILFLSDDTAEDLTEFLPAEIQLNSDSTIIKVLTKGDLLTGDKVGEGFDFIVSAKTGEGLANLKNALVKAVSSDFNPQQELIVTNARHYESLTKASEALDRMIMALHDGVPTDFVAQDLREATHHLGTITGAVTSDDILHTIFSRYCIGK